MTRREWGTSVLAGRRPSPLEKRYLRKDGEILWAAVDASFVPATETTSAFMATIIADITDRVRAEEALHRSQSELARVSRVTTMGQLAASIAHEINQPLTAIIASGNACGRWLANGENLARARKSLDRMIGEANRASEVIKRMRRLLAKAPLETKEVNLNEVVSEVFDILGTEAYSRRVTLSKSLSTAPPSVRGDRIALQQVVLNLVMNAIDAMTTASGAERRILGRTALVADASAELSIEDSGPGIPAGKAEQVFLPFFTTKEGGMGMGLSIARTIIESHGGRIWAENHPVGAVFRFSLPLVRRGVSVSDRLDVAEDAVKPERQMSQ